MEGEAYSLVTKFVHVGRQRRPAEGIDPIAMPIYRTAVFRHRGFGEADAFTYSRLANPTRAALEEAAAELAGGSVGLAFASGMAALAAAFSLVGSGERLVAGRDLYGHTYRLLLEDVVRRGVAVEFVDTWDLAAVARALTVPARAVFLETPSNPLMRITDLRAVVELAHAQGALVLVDNTFLTPYGQRPLELGADVEILSATKYLAGHNDVLAGLVVARDKAVGEELRRHQVLFGAVLSPDDAWLVLRGMKTLPLRLERQEANALVLAERLLNHPRVRQVYYPGLPDHPGHEVHRRQARSFGATLSFEVDSVVTVAELLGRVRVISYAESLGGVESLITHPAGQTHRDIPPEERRRQGISDRLLRLSVGIEDVADLWQDLEAALDI